MSGTEEYKDLSSEWHFFSSEETKFTQSKVSNRNLSWKFGIEFSHNLNLSFNMNNFSQMSSFAFVICYTLDSKFIMYFGHST